MKYTRIIRKLSDAEIVEKYAEHHCTVVVGALAGCSPTTVAKIIRQSGGTVQARGGRERHPMTLSAEEVCRRYLDGQSGIRIARDAGTYGTKIYQILKAAGIGRRPRGMPDRATKKKFSAVPEDLK